jgi:hypothetical protein
MQQSDDQNPTSRSTTLRVTAQEAAEYMGVTVEAVRGRIRRGTVQSEKAADGTMYVLLDAEQLRPTGNHPSDKSNDQTLLVTRLENEVDYLRQEVEDWKEEARRKDHLLAAALDRIPAIEAPKEEPPDTRESPVTASESDAKGAAVPHESAESEIKQSWWQRLFGG